MHMTIDVFWSWAADQFVGLSLLERNEEAYPVNRRKQQTHTHTNIDEKLCSMVGESNL